MTDGLNALGWYPNDYLSRDEPPAPDVRPVYGHMAAATRTQPQRVVFVDDGSPDALQRVAEEYMAFEEDPRVPVER